MANSTKMTKVEMFTAIANYIGGNKENSPISTAEMVSFIERQIELINNKAARASSKPTKTQTENLEIKGKIINALARIGKYVTISEIQEAAPELAEYTNQKLSALMRQMVEAGTVVKCVEKKKSYFTIAQADTEDEADSYANELSDTQKMTMLN